MASSRSDTNPNFNPIAGSGSSELLLSLRCDYPNKEAVIVVPGNTTFREFRSLAHRALDFEKRDDLSNYEFDVVSFATDVFQLGAKGDEQPLNEAGVKTRSTVLLFAPAHLRPLKKKRSAGLGANLKMESSSCSSSLHLGLRKKNKSKSDDPYAGLSTKNVLKRLDTEKLGPKKERLAKEFVDIHIAEIVNTPGFTEISSNLLVDIVKSNSLNIKEVDLFSACVAWARAEAARQEKKDDSPTIRDVLRDVLPHIRFPLMSTQEIAMKVAPLNILPAEFVLEIFTYLASQSSQHPSLPPTSLSASPFSLNTLPRKPRKPFRWFAWDPNRKFSAITLSEDNTVVSSLASPFWQTVQGNTELTGGTYEWTISLRHFDATVGSGGGLGVGVVTSSDSTSFLNSSPTTLINPSLDNANSACWIFLVGNGAKMHNNVTGTYSHTIARQGDLITTRVDLDRHTIEWLVNDVSQGVAYSDVVGPLRPVISLYSHQVVALLWNKPAAAK